MKNLSHFNLFLAFIIITTLVVFNFAYRTPLLLGFVFTALTFPIFAKFENRTLKLLKGFSRPFGAICTIIFVSTVLIVILNIFVNKLTDEIRGGDFKTLANNFLITLPQNQSLVNTFGKTNLENFSNGGLNQINEWNTIISSEPERSQFLKSLFSSEKLDQTLNAGQKVLSIGQQTFNIVFDFTFNLVVFILAWFFGLTSGSSWLKSIFQLLPLEKNEEDLICRDLKLGINNVIYANFLSGTIHTIICFFIMLIFGVPNIFIFSFLIFMIGVLPLSPSEFAYAIPILIIAQSNPLLALVLAILAELIVLFTNYVFLPRVIISGSEGNPLLILTSVMSGIAIFGVMGFIIGPVLMILVQTLYQILTKREAKISNLN